MRLRHGYALEGGKVILALERVTNQIIDEGMIMFRGLVVDELPEALMEHPFEGISLLLP